MIFKKFSFRTSISPFGSQGTGSNISIDSETDEQKRKRLQEGLLSLKADASQGDLNSLGVPPSPVVPNAFAPVDDTAKVDAQKRSFWDQLMSDPTFVPGEQSTSTGLINRGAQVETGRAQVAPSDMQAASRTLGAGVTGASPFASTGQTLGDVWALATNQGTLNTIDDVEQRNRIKNFYDDPTRASNETAFGIGARALADDNSAPSERYRRGVNNMSTAAGYLGRAALGTIGTGMISLATWQGDSERLETAGRMLESIGNANRIGKDEAKLNPYKTPEDAGLVTTVAYAGANSVLNPYWWKTDMADQIGMQLPTWIATAAATSIAAPVAVPARAALLLESLGTPLEAWLASKSPQAVLAIGRAVAPAVAPTSKAVGNALLSAMSESLIEAGQKGSDTLTETGSVDQARAEMGKNFYQGTVALLGTNLAEDLIVNKLIPFHAARYINNAPNVGKRNSLLRQVTARTVGDASGMAFSILKEMTEEQLQEAIQMNAGGSLAGNLYQGVFNPDNNQRIRTAGLEGAKFALGFRSAGAVKGASDALNALAGTVGPTSPQAQLDRGITQPVGWAQNMLATIRNVAVDIANARLEVGKQKVDNGEITQEQLDQEQNNFHNVVIKEIFAKLGLDLTSEETYAKTSQNASSLDPTNIFKRIQAANMYDAIGDIRQLFVDLHPDGEAGVRALVQDKLGEFGRSRQAGKFGDGTEIADRVAGAYGDTRDINGVYDVGLTLTPELHERIANNGYIKPLQDDLNRLAPIIERKLQEGLNTRQGVVGELITKIENAGLYRPDRNNTMDIKIWQTIDMLIGNSSNGLVRGNQVGIDIFTIFSEAKKELERDSMLGRTRAVRSEDLLARYVSKKLVQTVVHEIGHTLGIMDDNKESGEAYDEILEDFIIASPQDFVGSEGIVAISALAASISNNQQFINDAKEVNDAVRSRQYAIASALGGSNRPAISNQSTQGRTIMGSQGVGVGDASRSVNTGTSSGVPDVGSRTDAAAPGMDASTNVGPSVPGGPIGPDAGATDARPTTTGSVQQSDANAGVTDAGTTNEQDDTSGVRLSPEEETAGYRDLEARRQTIRSRVADFRTLGGLLLGGKDITGLEGGTRSPFGGPMAPKSTAVAPMSQAAERTGNPRRLYTAGGVAEMTQAVIDNATANGRFPNIRDFWDALVPGAPRPFDKTQVVKTEDGETPNMYFQSESLAGIPHPEFYQFMLHLAERGKASGSWYLNVAQFLADYVEKRMAGTEEGQKVSRETLDNVVQELLGYMGRSGQETTPRVNIGWAFQFLELRLLLQDTPSTATDPQTKKKYKNALDEVVQTNIRVITEKQRLEDIISKNKKQEWVSVLNGISGSSSPNFSTNINTILTKQFSPAEELKFFNSKGKPIGGHLYKYGHIEQLNNYLAGKSFADFILDSNDITFKDIAQRTLFIENVNAYYDTIFQKKLLNERLFGTMKPKAIRPGLTQYAPNKIEISNMGQSGSIPVEIALDFWSEGGTEIAGNMKLAQYYGAFVESLFNGFTMFSVPDRWMFKSFGIIDPDEQSTPSDAKASEFLMTVLADIASKLDGVTPTQLQAMIWTGLRLSILDASSKEIGMSDPYYDQAGNRQPRSLWGPKNKSTDQSVVILDHNGDPWSIFSGGISDAKSAGELIDILGEEDATFFKKLTKLMDNIDGYVGSLNKKKQNIGLNAPRVLYTPYFGNEQQTRVRTRERANPSRTSVVFSGVKSGVQANEVARSTGQRVIEDISPVVIVAKGATPLDILPDSNQLQVLRQESDISRQSTSQLGVPTQPGQQNVTNLQRSLTRLPWMQRAIEDGAKNYVPHYVNETDDHYEVTIIGATPSYARTIAGFLAAKAGVPTAQVWIPRASSDSTSTDPYTMRRNQASTLAITRPDDGQWTIKDASALVSNVLQDADQWTLGSNGSLLLIKPANIAELGDIADALVTVNNVPKESINVTNVDMMEPVKADPNASIRPYMQKGAPNFLQVFRNNTGIQSSRASDRPRGPLMGFPRARPLDPQGVTQDEWNDMIRNPETGEVSIFEEDGVWYGSHKDGSPFVVDPYDGRQRSLMKLPYVGERPVDPNAPVARPPLVSDRDMDVFNASLESTKKYYTDQGLPVPERVQQQMDAQIREMREMRERGTIRSNRTAAIPRIDQLDEMRDRGSIDRKILRDRQSMYGLGTSPTFFQDFATNVNFKTLLDNPFLSVSIPLNFGGSVSQALGINAGNMYSDMQGDPKRYQIDVLENVFNAVPATGTMAKSIANILKVPDTYYQIPALTAIVGDHVILTGRYGSWFSEGVTGLEANVRVVLEKNVSLDKARAAAAFLGAVTLQDGVGLWSPKSALPVKKWMDLGSTIGRLVSIVKNKLPQVLESEKAIVDIIKDSIAFQDQEDLQTALGKIFALMGLQTDQTIMPQLERALASAFPNGVVPTGPGARTGVNLWGNLKTNGNPDPLMRYLGITRDALNTNVIGIKTNEGMTTPATMAKVANALNQLGFGAVDLDTAGKHVVFIDYSPFTYNQDMTFGQVAKLVAVQQLKFATAMKLISDNNIASPKDMFVGTWANELVAVQDAPTPSAVWWASGALPTTDVAGNPASSGSVLFDPNGRSDAQTFQPVKTVPDLGTRAGFSAPWGGVPGRSYTTGRAMVKDVPVPSRTFGTMLEDWARNNPNEAIQFRQAVTSALGNLASIGIGNGSINPGAVGGVLEDYGVSDLADAYKEWLNKNIKTDPAGQQISDPNPAASREALSTYAGDASTRLIIQSSRATVRPDTDTLVDSISKQTPASMEDREFAPFTRVGSGQMAPSKWGKLTSDPLSIKSSRAQVTDQMREESKDRWVYTGDQWIRDFGGGVWGRVVRRASVDPKAFESGQPIAHAYRWGVGVSDAHNNALIAQKLANMTLYGQVDHQFITDAGVASVMYGRLQNSVFNKSGNQPTLDMTAANVNAMEAIRFAQMRGADIVTFVAAAEAYLEQYGLKIFLSKYIKEDNKANEILYYIKSRYNDQRSQQIMDVNQSDDSLPVNRNYAGDDFLRLKDMLAYGVGMATAPDLQGSYGSSLQVPRPFFSRPQFGGDFALIADVIDNKLGKKKKVLKPEQIAEYDMFENLEDISRLGSKLSIDYNVMQGNSGIAREYETFNNTPDDQKRITDFWELWDLWQKRNNVAGTFTKRGTIRGVVGRGAIRSSRAANTPPPEFIDPATGALFNGLIFENGVLKALRIANTKRGNAIMNAGMYNGEVLPVVGFREAWQNARDAIMLGLPAGVDKSKAVIDLIMVDGRASSKMFEDAMLGSLGHDVHFLSALDANGTPIVKASDFSGSPGSYSSHDHVLTPVVSRPFAETYPDDPTDNTGYADRTVKGPSSGFFVMHDTGGGMSPAKLATTFIQMFASGKEKSGTNTNSSGGFGLGVGAIFSASQYFEVMTTWRDPQTGKLVRTVLSGSGEDFSDTDVGVTPRIISRDVEGDGLPMHPDPHRELALQQIARAEANLNGGEVATYYNASRSATDKKWRGRTESLKVLNFDESDPQRAIGWHPELSRDNMGAGAFVGAFASWTDTVSALVRGYDLVEGQRVPLSAPNGSVSATVRSYYDEARRRFMAFGQDNQAWQQYVKLRNLDPSLQGMGPYTADTMPARTRPAGLDDVLLGATALEGALLTYDPSMQSNNPAANPYLISDTRNPSDPKRMGMTKTMAEWAQIALQRDPSLMDRYMQGRPNMLEDSSNWGTGTTITVWPGEKVGIHSVDKGRTTPGSEHLVSKKIEQAIEIGQKLAYTNTDPFFTNVAFVTQGIGPNDDASRPGGFNKVRGYRSGARQLPEYGNAAYLDYNNPTIYSRETLSPMDVTDPATGSVHQEWPDSGGHWRIYNPYAQSNPEWKDSNLFALPSGVISSVQLEPVRMYDGKTGTLASTTASPAQLIDGAGGGASFGISGNLYRSFISGTNMVMMNPNRNWEKSAQGIMVFPPSGQGVNYTDSSGAVVGSFDVSYTDTSDLPTSTTIYLSNGSYQYSTVSSSDEAASRPDAIIINIHPSVDPTSQGYPINPDRDNVKSWFSGQPLNWISTNIDAAIRDSHKQKVWQALSSGFGINGYDNAVSNVTKPIMLLDAGKTFDPSVIQGLSQERWVVRLADSLTEFYDEFMETFKDLAYQYKISETSDISRNQDWFNVVFAGLTMQKDLVAVNYNTRAVAPATTYRSQSGVLTNIPRYVMVNPFVTVAKAADRTAGSGVASISNKNLTIDVLTDLVNLIRDSFNSAPTNMTTAQLIRYWENEEARNDAAFRAARRQTGQPPIARPDGLLRKAREFVIQLQTAVWHEITHQSVSGHNESFGRALQQNLEAIRHISTVADMSKKLLEIVLENDGEILNNLAQFIIDNPDVLYKQDDANVRLGLAVPQTVANEDAQGVNDGIYGDSGGQEYGDARNSANGGGQLGGQDIQYGRENPERGTSLRSSRGEMGGQFGRDNGLSSRENGFGDIGRDGSGVSGNADGIRSSRVGRFLQPYKTPPPTPIGPLPAVALSPLGQQLYESNLLPIQGPEIDARVAAGKFGPDIKAGQVPPEWIATSALWGNTNSKPVKGELARRGGERVGSFWYMNTLAAPAGAMVDIISNALTIPTTLLRETGAMMIERMAGVPREQRTASMEKLYGAVSSMWSSTMNAGRDALDAFAQGMEPIRGEQPRGFTTGKKGMFLETVGRSRIAADVFVNNLTLQMAVHAIAHREAGKTEKFGTPAYKSLVLAHIQKMSEELANGTPEWVETWDEIENAYFSQPKAQAPGSRYPYGPAYPRTASDPNARPIKQKGTSYEVRKQVSQSSEGLAGEALRQARENVFQERAPHLISLIADQRGAAKGVLQAMIPFYRTIATIGYRGAVNLTPMGLPGIAYDAATAAIADSGPSGRLNSRNPEEHFLVRQPKGREYLPMSQRLGYQMIGMTVAMMASAAFLAGMATGAGPDDEEEKKAMMAEGWRPWSFLTKDAKGKKTYTAIVNVLGPLSYPVVFGVAWSETHQKSGVLDPAAFGAFAASMWDFTFTQSGLKSYKEAFDALEGGRDMTKMKQAVSRYASGFVPYVSLGRAINNAIDDTVRDPRSVVNHYTGNQGMDEWLSYFAQSAQEGIPGMSSNLPPKRNEIGQIERRSPGQTGARAFFPFQSTEDRRRSPGQYRYLTSNSQAADVRTAKGASAVNQFERDVKAGIISKPPTAQQWAQSQYEQSDYFKALRQQEIQRQRRQEIANTPAGFR